MRSVTRILVTVALACLPLTALAGDGVVEINAAAVLAGSVTPADTPGYPVTLSVPGSYMLTGDLIQPKPEVTVLEVTVADVAIDLNGFAIRGTNSCVLSTRIVSGKIVADDVTCAQRVSGNAIDGDVDGLSVRNGRISGVAGYGIRAGDYASISDIQISHTGFGSIWIGSNGTVRDAVLTLSGSSGIFENGSGGTYVNVNASRHDRMGLEALSACSVTNTTANWNAFYGFDIRLGCTATNVSASRNSNDGFQGSRLLLSQCSAAWNGGYGVGGSAGVHACVFEGNESGSLNGAIQLGPNMCDGALCP